MSFSRLHPRPPRALVLLTAALVVALFAFVSDAAAAPALTVTPITWNVVGLDSNNVNVGPNRFPNGVRVCNTGTSAATNVQAAFAFDAAGGGYTPSAYVSIADGLTRTVGTVAAGACKDVYWTVQVTRNSAAYDTKSRFQITVTADALAAVTGPANREIYVEKLVSQNRNAIIQPTPVVAGIWFQGPTSVRVGQTVTYTVTTKTATQGYEQLVHFTDFPSSIFRIVSTASTYTAPSGGTNQNLYADPCGWYADRTSVDYRSCSGTGKAGGNPIVTTYTLEVVGTGSASVPTVIYDFSGSSYHYNSDFGTSVTSITSVANAAPNAVDDTTTTQVGASVTVPMLANDSDPESDAISFSSNTAPSHGSVTCAAASCTYTPTPGVTGIDTFTYTIVDALGATATATVTITVNAPPDAVDDSASTTSGVGTAVSVLTNDTDANGDTLAVTGSTSPGHGTVSCTATSCTYTPTAGFVGTDSFTYTISDGHGGSDTATVTVTVAAPPNTPPVAVDDTAATTSGAGVVVSVLGNDTDANGDTLSVTSHTSPTDGAVVCTTTDCTYLPDAFFVGADTFTYTISDGNGGSATATVTVTVSAPPNTPPVAVDDSASTTIGVAVPVSVLGNDTDGDGDTLSVSAVTAATSGAVSCSASVCTYTPAPGFVGAATFDYTISDGHGGTDTGTVTVAVSNTPPVAADDSASTTIGVAVPVSVLGNDTDANGDPLSVSSHSSPSHGSVSCTASVCTYTPDAGFTGSDSFDYTISDGNGGTDTATVTVTVTAVPNTPPVAADDSASTTAGVGVPVSVLANDTDANGDSLSVTGSTQGAHGSVSCTASVCTYMPLAGFTGTDSFDYTISDGHGGTDTATVTVTVTAPPNSAPVAHDDTASTSAGVAILVAVLGNDTDGDGDTLTPSPAAPPAHGTATCGATGCTYTPDAGFTGTDTFTYTVTDGRGGFSTATVTVTVAAGPPPPNTPPTAVDDAVTTPAGVAVAITPLGNDTDPDGDPIQIVSSTPASHGTVTCSASQCTYAPGAGWSGTDTFTVTIDDGKGGTATSTVTVTVTAAPSSPPTPPSPPAPAPTSSPAPPPAPAANGLPVAADDATRVGAGGSVVVAALVNDTDPDGDLLEIVAFVKPQQGSVSCTASACAYTAPVGFAGTMTFAYTVSDGKGGLDSGMVTIEVSAPPRASTAPELSPAPAPAPAPASTAKKKKKAPVAPAPPAPTGSGKLAVSVGGPSGGAEPGDLVTYTIRIRNTGTAPLVHVVVCDLPADTLVFVRARGARFVRGQACWTIDRLAPGVTRIRTVTLRVDRFGVLGIAANVVLGAAGDAEQKVLGRDVVRVLAVPQKGRAGGVAG